MTRVNVIPVSELSDQHLIAEYRELPRTLKQEMDLTNVSSTYILGKGHAKWARRHWKFTLNRLFDLHKEMLYRGFKPSYEPSMITIHMNTLIDHYNDSDADYIVTESDIELNRQRILERYNTNKGFYKWSKRKQPTWML